MIALRILDVKTIKGLGKALREIEIHPFRLKDSSESFISSATLPQKFEWFSLGHTIQYHDQTSDLRRDHICTCDLSLARY